MVPVFVQFENPPSKSKSHIVTEVLPLFATLTPVGHVPQLSVLKVAIVPFGVVTSTAPPAPSTLAGAGIGMVLEYRTRRLRE